MSTYACPGCNASIIYLPTLARASMPQVVRCRRCGWEAKGGSLEPYRRELATDEEAA